MSIEITAAIFGAIFGALANGVIEISKYFTSHKSLKKALKMGLYFEIDHHKVVEISKDPDGQPNFFIESFRDSFYSGNIANLTRLFSIDLIHHLTFCYSGLKSAFEYQDELFKMTSKIDELIAKGHVLPHDLKKYTELDKQREGLKHVLRVYIAPCLHSRQVLLSNLKDVFKKDPAELSYIDVLPEHKEWYKKLK